MNEITFPQQGACCCHCGCSSQQQKNIDDVWMTAKAQPSWTTAFERLFQPRQWNFCLPSSSSSSAAAGRPPYKSNNKQKKQIEDTLKNNMLHNSATTCDLSESSSSEEEEEDWNGGGWKNQDDDDDEVLEEEEGPISPLPLLRRRQRHNSSPRIIQTPTFTTNNRFPPKTPPPPRRGRLLTDGSGSQFSSSSMMCRTYDTSGASSLHRRSHGDNLPSVEQIWPGYYLSPPPSAIKKRPSLIHVRGLSTGTQLTTTSFGTNDDSPVLEESSVLRATHKYQGMSYLVVDDDDDEEEESESNQEAEHDDDDDDLCFDLSVSGRAVDDEDDDDDVLMEEENSFGLPARIHRHQRSLSYCSSSSSSGGSSNGSLSSLDAGTTPDEEHSFPKDGDNNMELLELSLPDLPSEPFNDPLQDSWVAKWVSNGPVNQHEEAGTEPKEETDLSEPDEELAPGADKPSRRGTTTVVAAAAAAQEAPPKYHPSSYLPLLPSPPAAVASTMASILTVGWAAVFWESPIMVGSQKRQKDGNNRHGVPLVRPEDNIFFLQLLSGGMLQLTSAVDGARNKSVLVTLDRNTSNWESQLVSCRSGYCLSMKITASTISAQHRRIYILPVHLPPTYRSKMLNGFHHQGHNHHDESDDMNDHTHDDAHNASLLFTPFRKVESSGCRPWSLSAPHHQHDAVTYLRFALDAAFTMDAVVRGTTTTSKWP